MRVVTSTCLLAAVCAAVAAAQPVARSEGGGPLSETVVATWEAHGDANGPVLGETRTLDLLVLWRGRTGWFSTTPSAGGSNQSLAVGGTERMHRVFVHGKPLELRVDAATNTARIQDQVIPLQGSNAVMIDNVDATTVRVGTAWIDPKLDAHGDPVRQMLNGSPLLREFAGH